MRILRLNNDICELAEIDGSPKSMENEINGFAEILSLTSTLKMMVDREGHLYRVKKNPVATVLMRHFIKHLADEFVRGPAFLCSYDDKRNYVSLTDEDYEIAAKVLRSYGFVKGD